MEQAVLNLQRAALEQAAAPEAALALLVRSCTSCLSASCNTNPKLTAEVAQAEGAEISAS